MIRRATSDDAKTVLELVTTLNGGKENCAFSEEEFADCYNYNLENYLVYLFEEDGEVLGLCTMMFLYPLHHSRKIAEVLELVIKENARGKNVGKKLLEVARQQAQAKNCENIELSCNKKRKDAHRFYAREGFEESHLRFVGGV